MEIGDRIMNTTASLRPFLASLCLLVSLTAQDDGKPRSLTVHEWGTFTVLQDERGVALPGVNINEESLPRFVHRLSSELAPDSHENRRP
jgi:hypothetical protein